MVRKSEHGVKDRSENRCAQLDFTLSITGPLYPLTAAIEQTFRHFAFVPATDIDDANQIDEAQKTAPLNLAIQSPLGS
jgi:hypothetical protein